MEQVRRGFLIAGILTAIVFASQPVHAQYTANFQTNIISGVTSNWMGNYLVGSNTFADVLNIWYGGYLSVDNGFIGYEANSSNNLAAVASSPIAGGVSWMNVGTNLFVGYRGAANQLMIFHDGYASIRSDLFIGYDASSSNNNVRVGDMGSSLFVSNNLYIGYSGGNNLLAITNSGQVVSAYGYVGRNSSSSNNSVVVTGFGSVWSNTSLWIGGSGVGNSLVISNGGRVNSRSGDVGFYVGADQEHVLVSGTNSAWNVTGDLCFGSAGGKSSSLAITNGGLVVSSQAFLGYVAGDHMAIVRDPGSFWSAGTNFYIGRYAPGNQLLISNGGQVSNVIAYIGGNSVSSSNNSVLVTDPGSVWSNDLLYVGSGVGNRLVISNQASVFSSGAILSDVGGRGRSSVLVTGSGSIWSNTYYLYVGLGGQNNSLNIADGATLYSSYEAYVGDSTSSSNNVVIVSDPGSTWYNSGPLTLGYNGSGNSLILSNGGRAISLMTRVGQNRSTNNTVLVTGVGSVWSNTGPVHIDSYGNSFVISNGGGFISPFVILGNGSRNNLRVMDDASWQSDTLEFFGVSNSLAVAGGSVNATNVIVYNCDNIIQLDSGSLMITNLSGTATLELQGKLVINGGTLLVDRFVMTNPCAQFVRTGGTLIYGTAVLDPMRDDDGDGMPNGWEQSHGLDPLNAADGNVDSDGDGFTNLQEYMAGTDPQDAASAFRITGIAPEGDDLRVTWMMGSGKTNALQAAAGDGGYYTNNFADIFTVTNTIGSVTNYLDVGAATNVPGRFYRVRLVP